MEAMNQETRMTLHCPVAGCEATKFQIVNHNNISLLVCDVGHVIGQDIRDQLAGVSSGIGGQFGQTVNAHVPPIRKQLEEIKILLEKLVAK
jgi:hypothetical protein